MGLSSSIHNWYVSRGCVGVVGGNDPTRHRRNPLNVSQDKIISRGARRGASGSAVGSAMTSSSAPVDSNYDRWTYSNASISSYEMTAISSQSSGSEVTPQWCANSQSNSASSSSLHAAWEVADMGDW